MRAWAVVENGAPLKEIELPTPEPKGTEVLIEVTHCGVCHSDLHIWDGYYDLGGGQAHVAEGSRRDAAARDGPRDRRPRGEARPGREGREGRRPAHRVPLGRLRHLRQVPGGGGQHVPVAPRSLGVYRERRLRHARASRRIRATWSIPARSIRRVAATYACSGITVYSAIRKAMPLPPDEAIVLVGAGGLGLNAIAVLKALKHQQHRRGRHQRREARRGAEGRARTRWWTAAATA